MKDKTVVITGAAAGVGRAIAHRFARAGARLALIARDEAALNDVKYEVLDAGAADAMVLPLDVADAEAVSRAADRVEATLGPIEIWINDAMATVFSPVWEITAEEFKRVTEVTYLGAVHGTMAALRHMRPRGRGHVIQIGSALAYRGIPLQAAYCGAKHAMRGFTDSVRAELLHERSAIGLTMVQLPAVNTPQFDWGRTHMAHQPRPVAPVFQPEVIADHVFDAAIKRPRELWIGTSAVKVILGNMALPAFLDRFLARTAWTGQARTALTAPGRKDNLDAPVADKHATHGAFDAEAQDRAVAVSGSAARYGAAAAAGAAALLGFLLGRTGRG